jgi:hypothetical protein
LKLLFFSTEVQQQLTLAMPRSTPSPDVASSPMPARAEEVSRSVALAQLQASFSPAPGTHSSSQPLTVNVQVDGETIASAVTSAQRDSASRAFSPLPTY